MAVQNLQEKVLPGKRHLHPGVYVPCIYTYGDRQTCIYGAGDFTFPIPGFFRSLAYLLYGVKDDHSIQKKGYENIEDGGKRTFYLPRKFN